MSESNVNLLWKGRQATLKVWLTVISTDPYWLRSQFLAGHQYLMTNSARHYRQTLTWHFTYQRQKEATAKSSLNLLFSNFKLQDPKCQQLILRHLCKFLSPLLRRNELRTLKKSLKGKTYCWWSKMEHKQIHSSRKNDVVLPDSPHCFNLSLKLEQFELQWQVLAQIHETCFMLAFNATHSKAAVPAFQTDHL